MMKLQPELIRPCEGSTRFQVGDRVVRPIDTHDPILPHGISCETHPALDDDGYCVKCRCKEQFVAKGDKFFRVEWTEEAKPSMGEYVSIGTGTSGGLTHEIMLPVNNNHPTAHVVVPWIGSGIPKGFYRSAKLAVEPENYKLQEQIALLKDRLELLANLLHTPQKGNNGQKSIKSY